MPADQGILDAVSNVNTKVGGEAPATTLDLVQKIAVQNYQSMSQLNMAVTSKCVELVLAGQAEEAVSIQKTLTGNDLAQQLQQLLTALNSGQQGVKSAGNTPPVTP